MNSQRYPSPWLVGLAAWRRATIAAAHRRPGEPRSSEPWDVVEIVLVNGDPIQHNIALPDLGVQLRWMMQKDRMFRVVFG